MATIKSFEELDCWKFARELCELIGIIIDEGKMKKNYRLIDQMEGSSGSIMDNIAEGFERFTPRELRSFLVIARGSAGEVRSMVGVVVKRTELELHAPRLQEIRKIAEGCARQLGAWLQTIDDPKHSRKTARLRNSVQGRTPD